LISIGNRVYNSIKYMARTWSPFRL